MAGGTGLPIPKSGGVFSQSPGLIDGDALSSAGAWRGVAASFDSVKNVGLDLYAKEENLQAAGTLATFEEDWRAKNIEARDKFAKDPEGFKTWAQTSIEGATAEVPNWMLPHAKSYLTRTFDGSYSAILGSKRAEDDRLAKAALVTREKSATEDVQALVAGGRAFDAEGKPTPDFLAAMSVHGSVVDSQVKAGAIPQEEADYRKDDVMTKAQGEEAARGALKVYQEQGYQAAVDHLTSKIRDNGDLTLKQSARQAIFNRGIAALNLQRTADAGDRAELKDMADELRTRVESGQPFDPSEVRDMQKQLMRVGAHGPLGRLNKAIGMKQEMDTVNGLPLQDFKSVIEQRRGALSGNPLEIAQGMIGSHERNNRDVLSSFIGKIGGQNVDPATTAWCAAFVNAVLRRSGQPGTESLAARSFLKYGTATDTPNVGDIVVLSRGNDPSQGHVGFYAGKSENGNIKILGGNQGDAVSVAEFSPSQVIGYRQVGPSDARPVEAGATVTADGLPVTPVAAAGPYASAATARMQKMYVEQTRKAWPDFKKAVSEGKILDNEDMAAVRYGAHLSGDNAFINEVDAFYAANNIAIAGKDANPSERQFITDAVRKQATDAGFSVEGDQISKALEDQYKKQDEQVKNDPVGWRVEQGAAPPVPLNFKNPQSIGAAIDQRVMMAKGVAQDQQVAPGNPFRAGDRATIAGAIAGGDVKEAGVAFDGLSRLPDEMLQPALGNDQMKAAIAGAARSGDPARYNVAMTFLDRMWARNPDVTKALFGEDTLHSMMTWQSNIRYQTPEQMAKARDSAALDPQVRERMKALETAGNREFAKMSFDQVFKSFDESWRITPGTVARNVTGSQPLPPMDNIARATFMGDARNIYARRFAETQGDKELAMDQTVKLMKTRWQPSEVNGGKLMLNAPDKALDRNGKAVYPAVGGSHDWMNKQIEADIGGYLEKPLEAKGLTVPSGDHPAPEGYTLRKNWSYEIVPDRTTEVDAQSGRRPSYVITVKHADTGKSEVLPYRYSWDPTEAQAADTATFMSDRGAARGAELGRRRHLSPSPPEP